MNVIKEIVIFSLMFEQTSRNCLKFQLLEHKVDQHSCTAYAAQFVNDRLIMNDSLI